MLPYVITYSSAGSVVSSDLIENPPAVSMFIAPVLFVILALVPV